jgi:hypothetical protein
MDKNEDREGRQRRMPDIPAAVRKDFGRGSAFETIPGDRVDDELPRLYEIMELRCHGAVGEAWQQWLVDLGGVQVRALIKAEMDAFLALDQVKDIHRRARPQMRSVVNRFALYAASLRMAIAAGLLPWTVEEADAGIIACMERWVRESGNIDTVGELQRAVDRFWATIETAGRFISIHKNARGRWVPATEADAIKQKTPDQFDGYDVKDGHILVRPEAWRRFCDGADPETIAQHLIEKGELLPDNQGKRARKQEVLGKPGRYYMLVAR